MSDSGYDTSSSALSSPVCRPRAWSDATDITVPPVGEVIPMSAGEIYLVYGENLDRAVLLKFNDKLVKRLGLRDLEPGREAGVHRQKEAMKNMITYLMNTTQSEELLETLRASELELKRPKFWWKSRSNFFELPQRADYELEEGNRGPTFTMESLEPKLDLA